MIYTYKGKFFFNRKWHPGECTINNKNEIFLTIFESISDSYRSKIKGIANDMNLVLYNCRLVDFEKGYYKYQVTYLVENNCAIKNKKEDLNKHIRSFKFTFNSLTEWMKQQTIKKSEDNITLCYPNSIKLLDNENVKIYIKFFENINYETIYSIENLRIVPYICVKSNKEISYKKIQLLIQIITRFFALIVGYSSEVREIKFNLTNKKGDELMLSSKEERLIINTDFSNFYENEAIYYNPRLDYDYIRNKISDSFQKWYTLYNSKKYKLALEYYFSPYAGNTIEDKFLTVIKCIEEFSYSLEDTVTKEKENKKFHDILKKFYDENKDNLIKKIKDKGFKSKYIENIEKIHEEIANSVVYRYNNRISLSTRIRDFDDKKELSNIFDTKQCIKIKPNHNVYDYIANTRNFYTHLYTKNYILKDKYIPIYTRALEKIFIRHLLKLIIENNDDIENSISNDNYLNVYNKY